MNTSVDFKANARKMKVKWENKEALVLYLSTLPCVG
jgi:hypothetical protein